jgi:hypothetical protein
MTDSKDTLSSGELADIRNTLNEVVTNGEWTLGEQCGDWRISKQVYEMAVEMRDLLDTLSSARGDSMGSSGEDRAKGAGKEVADRVLVPRVPTEAMWGGLARDIVLWDRMHRHTGADLYRHLAALGRDIPEWLREEVQDIEHVPPKGTVAAIIYRAMIEAAPSLPGEAGLPNPSSDKARIAELEKALDVFAKFGAAHDHPRIGVQPDLGDDYVWLRPSPGYPAIKTRDFREAARALTRAKP